jgi:hypothetical protein
MGRGERRKGREGTGSVRGGEGGEGEGTGAGRGEKGNEEGGRGRKWKEGRVIPLVGPTQPKKPRSPCTGDGVATPTHVQGHQ